MKTIVHPFLGVPFCKRTLLSHFCCPCRNCHVLIQGWFSLSELEGVIKSHLENKQSILSSCLLGYYLTWSLFLKDSPEGKLVSPCYRKSGEEWKYTAKWEHLKFSLLPAAWKETHLASKMQNWILILMLLNCCRLLNQQIWTSSWQGWTHGQYPDQLRNCHSTYIDVPVWHWIWACVWVKLLMFKSDSSYRGILWIRPDGNRDWFLDHLQVFKTLILRNCKNCHFCGRRRGNKVSHDQEGNI